MNRAKRTATRWWAPVTTGALSRGVSVRLLLGLFLFAWPGTSGAQQVWFAPGDDLDVQGVVAHPDFQELFRPDAPWQTGLQHVDVMQIRAPWFLRMPDAAVRQVTSFLEQHHIALASSLGGVATDSCGKGVEGVMSARGLTVYPREMRRKGIRVSYALLDEPLFYGHDYSGNNACNLPISDVAHRVAWSVRMVRYYYPGVPFVLVEPVQSLSGGCGELSEFLDDYKIELGERPAIVRFDVQWHTNWRGVIRDCTGMLRARGIGYGIIYDATRGGAAPDDAAWVGSAESNVEAFADSVRLRPAQVSIQSWNPKPSRILPEGDPTTTSGFLKWYVTHSR